VRSLLRSWLGVDQAAEGDTHEALRHLLDALERHEPEHARHLARFAYLLGRVAHADQHVSAAETAVMEQLVAREGKLPDDQAMLVVGLAKTSTLLFGGSDDFIVARDFGEAASDEQKLALVRCLFAVSAAEGSISIIEEREIQRVSRAMLVEPSDLLKIRLDFREHLPGLARRDE
jgi:uncharacterized tellurite resistance protein B-like protein